MLLFGASKARTSLSLRARFVCSTTRRALAFVSLASCSKSLAFVDRLVALSVRLRHKFCFGSISRLMNPRRDWLDRRISAW